MSPSPEEYVTREQFEASEARVMRLRVAGDALWYCMRNAETIAPEELIEALDEWIHARDGR